MSSLNTKKRALKALLFTGLVGAVLCAVPMMAHAGTITAPAADDVWDISYSTDDGKNWGVLGTTASANTAETVYVQVTKNATSSAAKFDGIDVVETGGTAVDVSKSFTFSDYANILAGGQYKFTMPANDVEINVGYDIALNVNLKYGNDTQLVKTISLSDVESITNGATRDALAYSYGAGSATILSTDDYITIDEVLSLSGLTSYWKAGASLEVATIAAGGEEAYTKADLSYENLQNRVYLPENAHNAQSNIAGMESVPAALMITSAKNYTSAYIGDSYEQIAATILPDASLENTLYMAMGAVEQFDASGVSEGYYEAGRQFPSGVMSLTLVAPSDISASTVSVASGTYTGKALTPAVTVKSPLGTTLKSGTDYTVSYANNINAGTATVTITGTGAYTGTTTATFKISSVSLAKASVASIANKAYTGKALKPSPAVKLSGVTLKKSTDYTLGYKSNKKTGKATITITGKGNYSGTKTVTFKIKPKKATVSSAKSSKRAQIAVKVKKDTQATGYQIQIAKNKKFTSGKKSATLTKNTKTSKTFKKLTRKKTYYVKVRSYKTIDGKKVYGSWSTAKKVTVK